MAGQDEVMEDNNALQMTKNNLSFNYGLVETNKMMINAKDLC